MKKLISLVLTLCMAFMLVFAMAEFSANVGDGVVTLKAGKSAMFVVTKGGNEYRFAAKKGQTVTLPLTGGKGTYSIKEYVSIGGNRYKDGAAKKIKYGGDEFGAFKVPSSIVPYSANNQAIKKALELTAGLEEAAEKVGAIYAFIKGGFSYDYLRAAEVKDAARQVVDIDAIMEAKAGVCYDLSVLMVAMIRASGVPARLEIGEGHAWLRVYIDEQWKLIDPAYRLQTGQARDKSFAYRAEEMY